MLSYVEEIKSKKDQYFLQVKLKKEGREYPNYIANDNDSLSFIPHIIDNNSNNCEITLNGQLNLNLTNETIAELICVLPFINISQSNIFFIDGNIISEIKKSSLDIYENFRSLKAKWKAMQYLK